MTNGFILIGRKIKESSIWSKPPLYLKVWVFLLCNAQYQTYKGLERGQLITSVPEIQEACAYYVGYRKERPTKKQIADILKYLRNPSGGNDSGNPEGAMIATMKVTHGMLVTICNFNVYQDPKFYERTEERYDESPPKVKRRRRQGANINEEDKKIKIIPPYPLNEFCFSPELENQILLWLRYKAERNETYKQTGFKSLLKTIKNSADKYGEPAVVFLIEESMANNWKGIAWNRIMNSARVKSEERIDW